MAQIGLRNFYYAVLTSDTAEGVTYGTPKKIVGLNSIDINPSTNKATLYGDDSALATEYSFGEVEVSIDIATLPLVDKAALLGHTITDGVMVSKGSDSAPYVAIMFESKTHDGLTRFIKLLKGKFSESQETTNTRGESTEYQLPSLSATFVVREYDGAWKKEIDTSDTAVATTWYSSVEASA